MNTLYRLREKNLIALFYLALVSLYSSMALAQVVSEAPVADPQTPIEVSEDRPLDSRIENQLEDIFEKINGLESVAVSVDAAVVNLNGEVANEAMARNALDIAIRTSGVVTVTDEINRTLDISGNIKPLLSDFQDALSAFTRALPLILLALAIVFFFIIIAGFLARWSALWKRIAPNSFLSDLLSQSARFIVIVIGAVIALNLLGASKFISTILGGAGVLSIAIGFAVRDSLENYISSIMLSLRQPFRAQDHVQINQHEGIVVRLTSRATILMTLDGNHLRIPNSIVFKGIILNYSTNPERRFEFTLRVDGVYDPLAAMQLGLTKINQHKSVLSEPSAEASIDSVGDSSIIIKFTGWVDQSKSDFIKARSVAIAAAKGALEKNRLPLAISEASASEDTKVEPVGEKTVAQKTRLVKTVIDVSVNQQLQEKVSQERAKDPEGDLLDQSRPTE
ncbi:MAG: mechanosensitive ion channel [Arenicella sp.]|nr:mechanosensitive ion channel [Arenicella sp.]